MSYTMIINLLLFTVFLSVGLVIAVIVYEIWERKTVERKLPIFPNSNVNKMKITSRD